MKDVPAFFDGIDTEELKSLLGACPGAASRAARS